MKTIMILTLFFSSLINSLQAKEITVYEYKTLVDFNNLYSLGVDVKPEDFNIPYDYHNQYKLITKYYFPAKIYGTSERRDHENPSECYWGHCQRVSPYSLSNINFEDEDFKVEYQLINLKSNQLVGKDSAKMGLWADDIKSNLGQDPLFTSEETRFQKIWIKKLDGDSFFGATFFLDKEKNSLKINFDEYAIKRFNKGRRDELRRIKDNTYELSLKPNKSETKTQFISRGASLNTWNDFGQIVWVSGPGRKDQQLVDVFVKEYKIIK